MQPVTGLYSLLLQNWTNQLDANQGVGRSQKVIHCSLFIVNLSERGVASKGKIRISVMASFSIDLSSESYVVDR